MPLRAKLLLSLVSIAVIPLILFGFTSYQISTNSLMDVERDSLQGALDSVDRAFTDIQNSLTTTMTDWSNYDDLHSQVAQGTPDPDWINVNLDPAGPVSISKTQNLALLGLWNGSDKLLYSLGPVADAAPAVSFQDVSKAAEPHTSLLALGQDVYIVSIAPVATSEGKDPNGILLFGHKLGDDDVSRIKNLTGYDVAIYQELRPIAATQAATLTPAPGDLQTAAQGQTVFNQLDRNVALAFRPIRDEAGKTIATAVIWKSRSAMIAAQTSIVDTLAVAVIFGAALATLMALILGRLIARPLLAMADNADRMAAGDLSVSVQQTGPNDELGRLAKALNQMADKVRTRISESEAERMRLQAVDEHRLKLIAAITNAIQTPLETIRTHSESLELAQYGTLNDAQKRSVVAIRRSASVGEALLADLTDFAQAQQKQLRLARQRVSIGEIVEALSTDVNQRYESKHIQFVVAVPNDLPPVLADRTRLEQIVGNLLDYAFTLSIPAGRVGLNAKTIDGSVQVVITDTSSGLSAEERARLFELFYVPVKGDGNGEQSRMPGSVLGLAFVKAILEQQGGTIGVEVQEGRGDTFTFTLPVMR